MIRELRALGQQLKVVARTAPEQVDAATRSLARGLDLDQEALRGLMGLAVPGRG